MLDLATLNTSDACEVVHELELRHPVTDEPLGLFISHKGMNAAAVQKVARTQGNEILRKQFASQRKGKEETPTIEEGSKRTAKLLAVATTGWFAMEGGKRVEGLPFGKDRLMFSPDEAERLYDNPGYRWLRDQLDEAVGDLGNFMPT
jgi:hypothetical protein